MNTNGENHMIDDHNVPCSEVRLLPLPGGAALHVGRASYDREMAFRRQRTAAGAPYDLPAWEALEVVFNADNADQSDTPRTDREEEKQTQRFGCRIVKSEFARGLERELAAMTQLWADETGR